MNKEEICFTTRHVAGSGGVAAQEKWSALVLPSRTVDEDEFAEFLSENPARVHDILARLCHKLRDVTASYLEVCASLRQSVGDGAAEVDVSSDYHFVENPYLVGVHDRVAQTMHDDA